MTISQIPTDHQCSILPKTHAIWTAFLYEGLALENIDPVLNIWSTSFVELIQELAEVPITIWSVVASYYNPETPTLAGVFEYEVVVPIGKSIRQYLLTHGIYPSHNTRFDMIYSACKTYFEAAIPLPVSTTGKTVGEVVRAALTRSEDETIYLAKELLLKQLRFADKRVSSPDLVVDYLRMHIGLNFTHQEHFVCLFLDNKNAVLVAETLFTGAMSECVIDPKIVCRKALLNNAMSVICAHNHPSGDCEPSGADDRMTKKLKIALDTVGISLLDHIVLGDKTHYSYANKGTL